MSARVTNVARIAVIVIALLFTLIPLVWTALASIGITPDDTSSPPRWALAPSFSEYVDEIGVAEPRFVQELVTSAFVAAAATALTTSAAFLAAYAITRSGWRAKNALAQAFLVTASLPLVAYAIPLGEAVRRAQLSDTLIAVVLTQSAVYTPLAVYVLRGYLADISPAYEEAAMLEGAGVLNVIARVVLPMAAPGLAATALVLFVLNWNSFLLPLILASERVKTIPVAMSDFFTFERELDWHTAAAALIASLAPLAVLVAIAHQMLERFRLASFQAD